MKEIDLHWEECEQNLEKHVLHGVCSRFKFLMCGNGHGKHLFFAFHLFPSAMMETPVLQAILLLLIIFCSSVQLFACDNNLNPLKPNVSYLIQEFLRLLSNQCDQWWEAGTDLQSDAGHRSTIYCLKKIFSIFFIKNVDFPKLYMCMGYSYGPYVVAVAQLSTLNFGLFPQSLRVLHYVIETCKR